MLFRSPSVNSGRLRALAITSAKRSGAAPNVPTMIEAGFPGFESGTWFSLAAPAGSPAAALQRLNAEVNRVLQQPDVRERFAAQGAEPLTGNVEQVLAYTRNEIDKWARVVKGAGLKVE